MSRKGIRRAGLILAGVIMGILGLAIGLWFYLQSARVAEVRTAVGEKLQISSDAIERVEIVEETAIRIVLRDVVLFDEAGDTVLAAPRAGLTLDVTTLSGDGPIEFSNVALEDPFARLVRSPAGEWNFAGPLGLAAAGQQVETGAGRPLVFRNVEIRDGRVLLAIPDATPAAQEESSFTVHLPRRTIGGVGYQYYNLSDVQAVLPLVRIGGATGWRAEIGTLRARVHEPDLRIGQLTGWIAQAGEDGVNFDIDVLRIGDSLLGASGYMAFSDVEPRFDLELRARPLFLADLQPLLPDLPADGRASFSLGLESVGGGRLAIRATELDVDALGSRILGSLAVAMGGDIPLSLMAADLELAPLDLATLGALGIATDLPLTGLVVGNVSTAGVAPGFAAVDLMAELSPADAPGTMPSTIYAIGDIALGRATDTLLLDGLSVTVQPLALAGLRGLFPEQRDMLRGEIRGSVVLGGTLTNVRFVGGELSYLVGDAPPTVLTGLSGRVILTPELSYEFRAVAQPLALATLTELFPALPFRAASMGGPIQVSGNADGLVGSADLSGAAGGISFDATVALAEPFRFEVDGSVRAFAAGMILRADVPVEGPLTGGFGARGTLEQFDFDVDLTQGEGRFALSGAVTSLMDQPVFRVAGNVVNFRIGALIGSPDLFPDPMTGTLALEGGGGNPYLFDVDLTGAVGRLDLTGFYRSGAPPSYEARGVVAGLDVSRLPVTVALPPSALTGNVDIRGRGLDTGTLEGFFAFELTGSTISGLPMDVARGQAEIRAGVLLVDTLHIELDRTRLTARGSWGLSAPAPEPLSYTLVSPDIGILSRLLAPTELIPPQIAGSINAGGQVEGSFENPRISGVLTGRGLRYEEWRAADLGISGQIARDTSSGWGGQLTLLGEDLVLPQFEEFESVRLEASGNENSLAVGLFARRDRQSDIALSGLLELEGLIPRGLGLQTMELRLDGADWQLQRPARVRYTPEEGLLVENLVLEDSGPQRGVVSIHGTIPPSGASNLSLNLIDFDLADLRRITRLAPEVEGVLTLTAFLDGPVENPELSIQGHLENVQYEGVTTDLVMLDALYTGQSLTMLVEAFMDGQQILRADGAIPMNLSLAEMVPSFELFRASPFSMTLAVDSLPMALVAATVPGLAEGEGLARAQVQVGGTLDAPALAGWVRLDEGALDVEALSVRYTGMNADLELAGNRIVINEFSAISGGTLRMDGVVDFPQGAAPVLAVNGTFRDFRVMNDPSVATIVASGDLNVEGQLTGPVVTGSVTVSESTFQVPELGANQPGLELAYADVTDFAPFPDETVPIVPPFLGNLRVDGVQVSLAESVWLESDELRIQITGDLIVYRTGDEFRVFGALQAERGTYALEINAIVREFDVISGRVQFFGTGDLNPSIDIVGGYRVRGSTVGSGGDITILVQVTGTLLAPRLQLAADTPVPLSEADLISYLIFGQPSFELGGVTRAFAEQVLVQEVVGGIVASGLERPLLRAGICDWVRVRPGATASLNSVIRDNALAGAMIECGWEVAPDLFLTGQTAIGGLFGGDFGESRIGVEWQIDNEWMWEASFGTIQRDPIFRNLAPDVGTTQFSTDLRRQWEYGKPRRESAIDFTPTADLPTAGGPPLPPETPQIEPEPSPDPDTPPEVIESPLP